MKKGLAILAAASAVALAVPAAAQEGSMTGFRVEGLVGYDHNRTGSSANVPGTNQSFDGVSYGVGVGYDVDLGRVVVGAEGEYMGSTAKTNNDSSGFASYGISHVDAGRDLYAGARIGVKVNPRTLIYAKGGYTNAKYNILASDNTTDTDNSLKADGWRVGAGAQVNLTNRVYVKGEYRYSNYTEAHIQAPNGATSNNFDVDLDRHQVVFGVGAKF